MIVPPLCIIQLTDDQFASTMCSPPSTIPTKKVKIFKDIKDETFTYICFTEKAFMYYFFTLIYIGLSKIVQRFLNAVLKSLIFIIGLVNKQHLN